MKERDDSILLLDTHVWIWLMNGEENLFMRRHFSGINKASQTGKLRVSAISVWEIGMLESIGRIQLVKNCLDWVNEALSAPGIGFVPLTPEIAIESSRLPGEFHGDPADRILVASARILGAHLVTSDKKIIDYARKHHGLIRRPGGGS